jgi:mRNA interferase RelE/StbE
MATAGSPRYRIELKPSAAARLAQIPVADRRKVGAKIDALAENPRPRGVEKLKGKGEVYYRIRSGNYRIIYQVEDDRLLVMVVRIDDRKDAYKNL